MIFPHSSQSGKTRGRNGIWIDVQLRARTRVIADLLQFDWDQTTFLVVPASLGLVARHGKRRDNRRENL